MRANILSVLLCIIFTVCGAGNAAGTNSSNVPGEHSHRQASEALGHLSEVEIKYEFSAYLETSETLDLDLLAVFHLILETFSSYREALVDLESNVGISDVNSQILKDNMSQLKLSLIKRRSGFKKFFGATPYRRLFGVLNNPTSLAFPMEVFEQLLDKLENLRRDLTSIQNLAKEKNNQSSALAYKTRLLEAIELTNETMRNMDMVIHSDELLLLWIRQTPKYLVGYTQFIMKATYEDAYLRLVTITEIDMIRSELLVAMSELFSENFCAKYLVVNIPNK